MKQVMRHDYEGMVNVQLEERQLFRYPPFCHLIYVYLKHRDEKQVELLSRAMEEQVNELEETVVIGYGTQRKISNIGAQSTLKLEDMKTPSASLSTVLAGRLAGVIAVQRTGEPGKDAADIWIRGISTPNTSTPLVLVDGVERGFNDIDPEDIESFTILKDASATAVYGVRGANGVIIIKTKPGKAGKPSINADYYESFTQFTQKVNMADGVSYMQYVNREPRFYADITFNGQRWFSGTNGGNITDFTYSGDCGKKGGVNDYSITGYLVRKGMTALENTKWTEDHITWNLYVDGNSGGWIDFGYSDDYVKFGDNNNQAFTIELWVDVKGYCNQPGEDNSSFLSTMTSHDYWSGWRAQDRSKGLLRTMVAHWQDSGPSNPQEWEPGWRKSDSPWSEQRSPHGKFYRKTRLRPI